MHLNGNMHKQPVNTVNHENNASEVWSYLLIRL